MTEIHRLARPSTGKMLRRHKYWRLTDESIEYSAIDSNHYRGIEMSKGMDSKKSDKKKPAKTMKEKKAAKQEKKRNAK